MSIIKLERTNEYSNRLRKYGVYIDNIKAGEISNGENKSFDISPGKHTVVCKIDWCSSPTLSFEVSGEEIKTLRVGGFKNANWILSVCLGATFLLPFLKNKMPEFRYLNYLMIPIAGLLIYYITVGRKKYLSLKEI